MIISSGNIDLSSHYVIACRDVSYNELSGSFPSWINQQNLQLYVKVFFPPLFFINKICGLPCRHPFIVWMRTLKFWDFLFLDICFCLFTNLLHLYILSKLTLDFWDVICSNIVANNFTIESANNRWLSPLYISFFILYWCFWTFSDAKGKFSDFPFIVCVEHHDSSAAKCYEIWVL